MKKLIYLSIFIFALFTLTSCPASKYSSYKQATKHYSNTKDKCSAFQSAAKHYQHNAKYWDKRSKQPKRYHRDLVVFGINF